MNPAYLHLVSAHLPVVGTLLGLALFVIALGTKGEDLKRICLLVFFMVSLLALPTYLSGQPAANMLKRIMPGMAVDQGDQHAEVAVLALTGSLVLGVVALGGLVVFRHRKSLPLGYLLVILLLALGACALMAWTANLGTKIRHLEIRESVALNQMPWVR